MSGTDLPTSLEPLPPRLRDSEAARRNERAEQLLCCPGDLVDRSLESDLVRLGGPSKATQLADELQRRSPNFVLCCWRLEVMEHLDITAHKTLANFLSETTIATACPDPLSIISIAERSEHLP
jgi:hypothetical protein